MRDITLEERKTLIALIWALKPSDLSVLQICLQSPPNCRIGTVQDCSNDVFWSELEKMEMAAIMPLMPENDTSSNNSAKPIFSPDVAFIKHLGISSSQDQLKSFMLTETGHVILPKAIEVSFGGYPHKEAIVSEATLRILNQYALEGDASAMNKLGSLYSVGRGVTKNFAEALSWYKKAAEKGDKLAHNNIGILYFAGEGVTKDYSEAEKWFRKAAELGSTGAMDNLGEMYLQGNGVEKKPSEAFKWFRLAADHGHGLARCKIGDMYMKGLGIEPSPTQAYVWFSLAIPLGYNVQTQRDHLAAMLSPEQTRDANRLVAEWKPIPPPKTAAIN